MPCCTGREGTNQRVSKSTTKVAKAKNAMEADNGKSISHADVLKMIDAAKVA